jgi:hypothetical protein
VSVLTASSTLRFSDWLIAFNPRLVQTTRVDDGSPSLVRKHIAASLRPGSLLTPSFACCIKISTGTVSPACCFFLDTSNCAATRARLAPSEAVPPAGIYRGGDRDGQPSKFVQASGSWERAVSDVTGSTGEHQASAPTLLARATHRPSPLRASTKPPRQAAGSPKR